MNILPKILLLTTVLTTTIFMGYSLYLFFNDNRIGVEYIQYQLTLLLSSFIILIACILIFRNKLTIKNTLSYSFIFILLSFVAFILTGGRHAHPIAYISLIISMYCFFIVVISLLCYFLYKFTKLFKSK